MIVTEKIFNRLISVMEGEKAKDERFEKALSVCLAAMLVSAPCMMVSAEETADAALATEKVQSDATVKLIVGEPDDNGIFTAKLSIHNANFLGMQFGFNYNKSVVVAVDENGKPTDQLREATTFYPFEKDDLCAEFIVINSKLSNENGLLQVASVTLESNGKELVADDAGFLAYEFRFKKIAEGDAEFALADYPYANYEKKLCSQAQRAAFRSVSNLCMKAQKTPTMVMTLAQTAV